MKLNPLKEYRTTAGLTLEQLAAEVEVPCRVLIWVEQGLYNAPNPKVCQFWVQREVASEQEIKAAYSQWQIEKRQSNSTIQMVNHPVLVPVVKRGMSASPFALWRRAVSGSLSQLGFCQALCVHLSSVQRYELAKQREMPEQLFAALEDAKLFPERLKRLVEAGQTYYDLFWGV